MRFQKLTHTITPLLAVVLLTACGGGADSSENSSPEIVEPVAASPEAEKAPVTIETESAPAAEVSPADAQAALLKRGRIVWFKCRSCHEYTVEGPHKVGPNLNGLIGAKAGVKEGFVFSEALKDSGIVWDVESLDAFIEKPSAYVKGTKMAFVGIKKESDRQALIAYMQENTKPPAE